MSNTTDLTHNIENHDIVFNDNERRTKLIPCWSQGEQSEQQ